jgi:superfamily I DNA/RNA helicase/RecB family exonuclease
VPATAPDPDYRLVRRPPPLPVPLDPDDGQRRVLAHRGGPLLVLAGPGTGKTATLVEAAARRVETGLRPDQVLVLTFSRRAAAELRERITARLGATTVGPAAWTFHSWCYALLRRYAPVAPHLDPPRLLSGPEQDVALRELLRGSLELGRPRWPAELRGCLTTRGLAEEVRALFARARALALEPDDLAVVAARAGRADWAALAGFHAEYLDVLDAQGTLDYPELISRAVALARRPDVHAELRDSYHAVFVDEYQDTDPAQERLLSTVAGGGRDLTVVGDPDQSIYAFRGAEAAGLLQFPDRFRHADGRPADVVTLRRCRRAGPRLLEVAGRVAGRIPAPGLPTGRLREHRSPVPASRAGEVEVLVYPSVGAEAEAVADVLRREHLERGTPWDRMAVLVRSAVRTVPLLRRELGAAGVPVEVARDEIPLAREPSVAPLLLALRCVADPAALTAETARLLLTGPLVGADPGELRRLGRALRGAQRRRLAADPHAVSRLPDPSATLIRDAVADPRALDALADDPVARPVRALADLLTAAGRALAPPGGPETALWALWSASGWGPRLTAAARSGGAAGRAADRDLDAVVALFAAVARAAERRTGLGVGPLLDELEAQQIPGDTLAERGVAGVGVRLLTAHRSKGLEWDVVVVCGVQDGGWPDLRRRHSLLEADRLDRAETGGVREPVSRQQLLADERRLFYVALTRARRRLLVTAVESTDDHGERPSRFLEELGEPVQRVRSRLPRPLALPAAVAQLRRWSVDATASPALRRAAVARLARLASPADARVTVPAAQPGRWWGLVPLSGGETPPSLPEEPLALSATSLTGLIECPLRWFLQRRARADSSISPAMGFGGVVHALVREVADGHTPPDLGALERRLDRVWRSLAYDAPWQSDQQRDAAREALRRFLAWHTLPRGRRLVASEEPFSVELDVPGGRVRLHGSVDRVELADDGRVHVVDFKTGRSRAPALDRHPQLGVYQLAARHGAFSARVGAAPAGGAELVHLRLGQGRPDVQQQAQLPDQAGTWVEELLARALRHVVEERFPATPHKGCDFCPFRRCCPAWPDGRQVVS